MEGLVDGVLPATVETYEGVAEEAHRLKRITEDLSFMSRAEEGAVSYLMTAVDLAELARRTVERMTPSFDDARRDEMWAVLAVADSGDGLDQDHLEIIFERFTRFREGAGLGIGLNIARSIVVGHGGTLQATSDGIGCGASFTLKLPLRTS